MSRNAQVIVLCEDKQHRCFCERLLKRMGFTNYRTLPLPAAQGAGGAYVDAKYPDEVRAQRARQNCAMSGLPVMREADNKTVQERRQDFDAALPSPRQANEHIALFIPKWELETWLQYLRTDEYVDEGRSDYPKLRGRESECHPQVDRLLDIVGADHLPGNCPPSLRRTIEDEYPRLASVKS